MQLGATVHDAGKRPITVTGEDKNEQSIFGIRASKNQSNQVQSVTRKLENSVKMIENIVGDLKKRVTEQDYLIANTVQRVTRDYLDKYRVTNEDGTAGAGDQNSGAGPGYTSDPQLDGGLDRQ